MIAGIAKTVQGYRMTCPNGHTDLILGSVPDAPPVYAPQVYCPFCPTSDGRMQPVCSVSQLEEFARMYADENKVPILKVLQDVYGYFRIEVKHNI